MEGTSGKEAYRIIAGPVPHRVEFSSRFTYIIPYLPADMLLPANIVDISGLSSHILAIIASYTPIASSQFWYKRYVIYSHS